eukprot:gb/GEZN01004148.1/.p1 GENE.gb/GEZN01004148.1/~~gb/GEZN01004148.1/.p1  ORF type:complete len:562 (+),score=74.52 gb/GEZN01004148.1/:70-1686(+)
MAGRILPKIFREDQGAEETKGEHARMSAFIGAIAVADLVKTTLGPKGMDKILMSMSGQEKPIFTNDGATILRAIPVDNPAAKILIDTSKIQDQEVGDGTTSVAVFAGELLREAEKLVNLKMHPQTIIHGWRKAVLVARKALEGATYDNRKNPETFRQDLMNIARTTLSSKILSSYKDFFSKIAVDAVLRLKGSVDLEHIQIIKISGGSLEQSYLEEGFILAKRFGVGQPKRIENARVLLANTQMDTDKIKIYGARVKVGDVATLSEIEDAEKKKMKNKVERILKHKPNVFINRQLIYNLPEQMFTAAGISAIEHADFEGIERLGFLLGGEIASTFGEPGSITLGKCGVVEETMIGEEVVIRFSKVAKGEACSIVLRGATQHILDEAERSLHDALCVLIGATQDPRIVCGGGCTEMLMANAVDNAARGEPGKEAIAMESFAHALRQMPTIIADNAGYDSADLVSRLRAAHHKGQTTMGLDMEKGRIGDMKLLQVTESFKSKNMVVISAHEAAEMIVRVDDIIKCAPRKRKPRIGKNRPM